MHPRFRPPRVVLATVTVLLAAACGPSAHLEPEVAPLGEPAPVDASSPTAPEATVVADRRSAPAPRAAVTETEPAATPDAPPPPVTAPAAPAPTAPAPAPEPAPAERPTTSAPVPVEPPPPPDLVVGEDGCVTDRTTGLVVACHDDAAGPDDAG